MSLGSENPEKFSEAQHESVAHLLVEGLPCGAWLGASDEILEEEVVNSLDQLSLSTRGDRILYNYLCAQAPVSEVMDRFLLKIERKVLEP